VRHSSQANTDVPTSRCGRNGESRHRESGESTEVQYKPTENLELRWVANIQRGGLANGIRRNTSRRASRTPSPILFLTCCSNDEVKGHSCREKASGKLQHVCWIPCGTMKIGQSNQSLNDGGERGIRSLGHPLDCVSCTKHIARNAGVAVGPCSFLPPEGATELSMGLASFHGRAATGRLNSLTTVVFQSPTMIEQAE